MSEWFTYRYGVVPRRHCIELDVIVEATEDCYFDTSNLTRFELVANGDVNKNGGQHSSDIVRGLIVHSICSYIHATPKTLAHKYSFRFEISLKVTLYRYRIIITATYIVF